MKRVNYLNLSWVTPSRGLRTLKAKIVRGEGGRPKGIIYPKDEPCTERRFYLYKKAGELRLFSPTPSPRRLKRFCRDYVRFNGGEPNSSMIFVVPWA